MGNIVVENVLARRMGEDCLEKDIGIGKGGYLLVYSIQYPIKNGGKKNLNEIIMFVLCVVTMAVESSKPII